MFLADKLLSAADTGRLEAVKEVRRQIDAYDMKTGLGGDVSLTAAGKLGKKEQAIVDARKPKADTKLGELMAMRKSDEQAQRPVN